MTFMEEESFVQVYEEIDVIPIEITIPLLEEIINLLNSIKPIVTEDISIDFREKAEAKITWIIEEIDRNKIQFNTLIYFSTKLQAYYPINSILEYILTKFILHESVTYTWQLQNLEINDLIDELINNLQIFIENGGQNYHYIQGNIVNPVALIKLYGSPSREIIEKTILLLESSNELFSNKEENPTEFINKAFQLSIEISKLINHYSNDQIERYELILKEYEEYGINIEIERFLRQLSIELMNIVDNYVELTDIDLKNYLNLPVDFLEKITVVTNLLNEVLLGTNKLFLYQVESTKFKPVNLNRKTVELIPVLHCQVCDFFIELTDELHIKMQKNELEVKVHHDQPLKRGVMESDRNKQFIKRKQTFSKLRKAIELQNSPRLTKKAQAFEIFKEVIDESNDISAIIQAHLGVCELHLYELRGSGDGIILEDIKAILGVLRGLSHKHHLNSLFVEVNIISCKIQLITGDISNLDDLLQSTLEFVKINNLQQYIKIIEDEMSELTNIIEKSQEIVKSNSNLLDRINQSNVESYLSNIKLLMNVELNL